MTITGPLSIRGAKVMPGTPDAGYPIAARRASNRFIATQIKSPARRIPR
jgi:hypothetical protein